MICMDIRVDFSEGFKVHKSKATGGCSVSRNVDDFYKAFLRIVVCVISFY